MIRNTYDVAYVVETIHTFRVVAASEDEAQQIADELMQKRIDTKSFGRYLPGDPELSYVLRKDKGALE